MKLSLCNEVLRGLEFPAQCEYAAKLGYDGLEVAPFTLTAENPHLLPHSERRRVRRAAEEQGIQITGLHWLLVKPEGLSITTPDTDVRKRTLDVMKNLVALCADLGGKVLVHGSPAQRMVAAGEDPGEAWKRAQELFSEAARAAEAAGVVYCLEALTSQETNFINTVAEAARMVRSIESPAFRTMIDTKAAAGAETQSAPELIEKWLPTGVVAHIHINDRSRRAPGQGTDRFGPVLSALLRLGYSGVVGVEPFDYQPDGPGSAAFAAGYVRGLLEMLRSDVDGGTR